MSLILDIKRVIHQFSTQILQAIALLLQCPKTKHKNVCAAAEMSRLLH